MSDLAPQPTTRWPRNSLETPDSVLVPAALGLATFLAATPWLQPWLVPGGLLGLAGHDCLCGFGDDPVPGHRGVAPAAGASPRRAALPSPESAALFAAGGLHPDGLWQGLTHRTVRVPIEIADFRRS